MAKESKDKTIFRVVHGKESPFVCIAKEMLYDKGLSLKAKGLLAFLLSKPDDWSVYAASLESELKEGREAIYSALHELNHSNYISIEPVKVAGRFAGNKYTVYETRQPDEVISRPLTRGKSKAPHTGEPHTGKPHTENPQLLNNDLLNNDRLNNDDEEATPISEAAPVAADPVESSSLNFESWLEIIKEKARKRSHYLVSSPKLREAYKNLSEASLMTRFDYIDSLLDKYHSLPTGHLVQALLTLEDRPRELFTPAGSVATPPPPEKRCAVCGAILSRGRCDRCETIEDTSGAELAEATEAYRQGGVEAVKAYHKLEAEMAWAAVHATLTA